MKKLIVVAVLGALGACAAPKPVEVSGDFTAINYEVFASKRFDFSHTGSVMDALIKLERMVPEVALMKPSGVSSNKNIYVKLVNADLETVLSSIREESLKLGIADVFWEQSLNGQTMPVHINYSFE